MSTPLSFCDISARYGQAPAPQQTIEEQTGWNPKQHFLDYLQMVRDQREKNAKEAEEDALMAMIDAMNAPKEDQEAGKTDMAAANSLANAGKAIINQHTMVQEDGTKVIEWVDPTATVSVQALMACLGHRFVMEQTDKVQENQEKAEELDKEQSLEVTETHDPSETSESNELGKEV